MKRKAHLIAGLLFLLLLFYDLFLWGGLTRVAGVGPMIVEGSQREVGLASVYLPLGRELTGLLGADAAAAWAATTFEPLVPRLLANPRAAMDTLLSGMPWLARVAYYGAPLLLLLSLFLWWRRPRGVHMMGGR